MIRLFLIFLIIPTNFAYPTWFKNYIKTHEKKYTPLQKRIAFHILKPKYEHIKRSESDLELVLHVNSDVKYRRRKLNIQRASPTQDVVKHRNLGLPLKFDWRTHGYVTPPKNQGSCGGCYCFSAITNLEYWYKKKTGKLKELSIQQCMDCSKKMIKDADGCDGGLMEDVYELNRRWTIGEDSFDKFVMRDKVCPRIQPLHGIRTKSYRSMSDETNAPVENQLVHNLLRYGPVPVGIDSTSFNFELYKSGIIRKHHCGNNIDHAVTVVGYDIKDNIRYWIIKNSWGKNWGVDGYFYLERDRNSCGINSYASFATDVEVI